MVRRIVDRAIDPAAKADDAAEVLAAGSLAIAAKGLWRTMVGVPGTVVDNAWAPDLSRGLHFVLAVDDDVEIGLPENIPGDDGNAIYFGITVVMDETGGHAITFAAGWQGEAPDVLTESGDETDLSCKVRARDSESGEATGCVAVVFKEIPAA
jgi:hypothetical protein